ncbi:hypothetical protein [Paractinoplanes rishiriensis]|uniref:Secreted protein n=1 Tax=Paractinoplanes rishiriensis TaxID=1050105 RepID=A0A919JXX0_9ACTN|nr:hypothetical protein [Actinoplanes rishiriensis]GIE95530.1 hypothetical protein Ari01nite_29950 [Actinoplanes rishiriensis]
MRTRWTAAILATAATATLAISTPAQAAPLPKSCAEIYRGLEVASMCVDFINPAPPYAPGSGYWKALNPRIENPSGLGATNIWAIYYNNAGTGRYLGRIADGTRWGDTSSSVGKLTAKFEVAMSDGWTRCVYLIPGGSNTEVGHC